jgi:hypothetical protein
VYLGRWNPFWETVVRDRNIPLKDRLVRHYVEYTKIALTRDWVRIYMFSGLRGEDINSRYLQVLKERILEPIAIELRHEFGLPSIDKIPLQNSEIELVWGINGRLFYVGQRKWIFDVPMEDDLTELIEITVTHFLAGAEVVLPQILDKAPTSKKPKSTAKTSAARPSKTK